MYPKYFGLKEPSFSIAPDPQYLFLSEQHREALAHLLYGAGESGGFVLLTGEVGTGKTTVCRAFLEQLPEGVEVALILNPAVTANELLQSLCDEFRIQVPEGERSIKALVDRLNAYLLDAHGKGRRPVLIIDEAQSLRPKVLEQVRLLTNLETSKHKLLQIFLIGQPELRRLLERDALRQINQRITARFHLRPFDLAETGEYIRHRVAVAGVDRPLFTAAAIRHIYRVSGGVPRLVNILCDRALLGACVTRSSQVTPAIVKRAAREVQGESIDVLPRPAVRPAFAAAAAFVLAMVAGWLAYDRMFAAHGDRWVARFAGRGEAASSLSATAPEPGGTASRSPADAAPRSLLAPIASSDETPVQTEDDVSASAPIADVGIAADLPRVDLAGFQAPAAGATIERLSMPEADALRLLLRRWGIEIETLPSDDPCASMPSYGLRCERGQGRIPDLARIDRPALLRARTADGRARYLLLGALEDTLARVDRVGVSELVPVEGLESISTGEFVLLWQPPPTGSSLIGPGASGDAVRWLRKHLSALPDLGLADGESDYFDRGLTRAVQTFQASRGLAPDGIAGPWTLIQLHNAVDLPGIPRLVRIPDAPATAHAEPTLP